ncbi:MAG: hypothetical protein ACYCPH_02570 [Minisyncoccota bacterium]
MIYLFYGNDVVKTRAKAFAWVATARAKDPSLTYIRLSREDMTRAALEDAALSGGLFTKRLLILLDDPFPLTQKEEEGENESENEDSTSNTLETYLDVLAVSENAILILAPKLAAAKAKKLATKAKIEYKFDLPAGKVATRAFNQSLVNALAAKNREKFWLEMNRALRQGDAPEMLHGLLQWKARDLMSKGGRAWTSKESRHLSLALIVLLQDSRRGGLNLSLSLERFALSV